jgi:pimeloyl-ACP methyl ester carboxylesterase
MTTLVLIAIGLLVCVFSAGLIAKALRIAPQPPEQLYWGDIPIAYVEVGGDRIRYIKTGSTRSVLGETVMRLRNPVVETRILDGGLRDRRALTPGFLAQEYLGVPAGTLPRLPQPHPPFASLGRGVQDYGKIGVPVLVHGDQDWSRAEERRATVKSIPGARMETVPDGGHFLPLDQPERLADAIKRFA